MRSKAEPEHVQTVLLWHPGVLCDKAVWGGGHLEQDDVGSQAGFIDEAVYQVFLQRGVVRLVVDNEKDCLSLFGNPLLQILHLLGFASLSSLLLTSFACIPDHVLLHLAAAKIRLDVFQKTFQLLALKKRLKSVDSLTT